MSVMSVKSVSGTHLMLLTVATLCVHSVAQMHVATSGAQLACTAPLPDLVHTNVRPQPLYAQLKDQLLSLCLFSLCGACLKVRCFEPLKHFVLLWNAAFVMRAACFASTTLPDASQCCTVKVPCKITRTGTGTERMGMRMRIETGSCHDLCFSGHVATSALAALTAVAHVPALAAPACCLVGTQAFVTAASRAHYTVDVLVALFVSCLLAAYFFKRTT